MKIGKEKFVELSYTLTVNGEVADAAGKEAPLGFVFGAGMLLPAFEKHIEGKKVGESYKFTLTPEEGYGVSDPKMIVELPNSVFEVEGKIEEGLLDLGNMIPMMTADGMHVMGRVVAIAGDNVRMDFNHPMADKTLNFEGEIVSVREATEEDFPQMGGCSCGCDSGDCGDCDSDKSGCGCN